MLEQRSRRRQASTDGGTTWEVRDTDEIVAAENLLHAGVLSGEKATLYRSTDDGNTWTATK